MKIDDPVGAISVHLVCGIFGTAAVGLFSAPELRMQGDVQQAFGLVYGGGLSLLMVQIAGIVIFGLFACSASAIAWTILKHTMGIRVTVDEELVGLDLSEMGLEAYPGQHTKLTPESAQSPYIGHPASVPLTAMQHKETAL